MRANIEAISEKMNQAENKLNTSEKEKDDLKTKFNDEFVLMSQDYGILIAKNIVLFII